MQRVTENLGRAMARIWPGSLRRLPAGGGDIGALAADPLVILHHGQTPTLDFYFKTRFPNAVYVDTASGKPDLSLLPLSATVVVVRHLPRPWLAALHSQRSVLSGIYYFMDDDIPCIVGAPDMPVRYALRTGIRFSALVARLGNACDGVLVSTPGLAEKYGLPECAILPPLPLATERKQRSAQTSDCVKIFYHGTASHQGEIRWLLPVVTAVMRDCPQAVFEISGDQRVRTAFADVERVRVVLPMSWPRYRAYTSTVRMDIGLAPLLDTPFNRCRSHVKLFDITRTGAVGVYAAGSVFEPAVRHGVNGMLAPQRMNEWVDTILSLAEDGAKRAKLATEAVRRLAEQEPLA